jgi:hypothetical protein
MNKADKVTNRAIMLTLNQQMQAARVNQPKATKPHICGTGACACGKTISANKTECYNCQRAREEREDRERPAAVESDTPDTPCPLLPESFVPINEQ